MNKGKHTHTHTHMYASTNLSHLVNGLRKKENRDKKNGKGMDHGKEVVGGVIPKSGT